MKINVYSIFDDKGGSYGNPFFFPHDGLAIRAFGDLVCDKNTSINKHPGDFSLYKLAEFDNVKGNFECLEHASFLSRALDFVPAQVNVSGAELV